MTIDHGFFSLRSNDASHDKGKGTITAKIQLILMYMVKQPPSGER